MLYQSPLMEITVDESTAIPVVGLRGELDIATVEPVRKVLYDRALRQPGHLVIDLSGLSFCGCVGVDMLLAFHREVADPGQTVLAGCTREVLRVFDVTGVRDLFDLADTVDEAIAFLRGLALYC